MNKKLNSNNVKNDKFTLNFEDNDYSSLISRLIEIKTNISLLEKKYLNNF